MDNLIEKLDDKINLEKKCALMSDVYFHDVEKIINSELFKEIPYNDRNYKRYTVYIDDLYEIILIEWDKNSESSIHDHGENGCIFRILKGFLLEEIYKEKNLITTSILSENDTSYINNSIGYHKIYNKYHDKTYSLHLYSPPNYIANTY